MAARSFKVEKRFFAAWRHYRFMSLADASSETGMTVDFIAALEEGREPFHQHDLEALAKAYRCSPTVLLASNPQDVTTDDPKSLSEDLRRLSKNVDARKALLIRRLLSIALEGYEKVTQASFG